MKRSLLEGTLSKIHGNKKLRKQVSYISQKCVKSKSLIACPILGNHAKDNCSVRRYKCTFPECGKSFNEKSNLKIHMRVHTNERPFMCSHDGCDKTFRTKANCKDHERRHYADK